MDRQGRTPVDLRFLTVGHQLDSHPGRRGADQRAGVVSVRGQERGRRVEEGQSVFTFYEWGCHWGLSGWVVGKGAEKCFGCEV
jgi:hypothetical protein